MKYEIVPDGDPQNPRTEYETFGTILYTSTRYQLGDKRVTADEIESIVHDDDMIVLPVYAYIHSGTILSTSPFGDPWDSGQCGIIYIEKDKASELLGLPLTSDELGGIQAMLRSEVKTFSTYLAGDVVGWVVADDCGDAVDSCWGYYCREDAEADAKRSLDRHLAERAVKNEHTVTSGG